MTTSQPNKRWLPVILLLVVIIAIGGAVAWSRYSRSQPIEISLSPPSRLQGEVYIGGAVNNPGIYPLKAEDTVTNLIEAAGGATSNADLPNLTIYVPETTKQVQPQKVDINRAEAWLLKALPGIGEARAQAIIDYRNLNGAFHTINELLKVKGISNAVYEQIEPLVTVTD